MFNINNQKFFLTKKFEDIISSRLSLWEKDNIVERFWKKDPTVWKEKPEDDVELSNRLGWLNLPSEMQKKVKELSDFAEEIKDKFSYIIHLGMGGSSLAPEVFFKTFGNKEGYPKLQVLDSTHPESVKNILDNFDLKKCLFIVASKSGGTTETMSFYYTMFDAVSKFNNNPGDQFIAITDPGSSLEKIAKENKFKKIFSTPGEVGGRYSVFTYFGLVPAALIGTDILQVLKRGEELEKNSRENVKKNPGFLLGAALGELASNGIDKLTIIASNKISSFPVWIEQLVAESTGKEGKGILPVVDEPIALTDDYSNDRMFVYLRLKDDINSQLDSLIEKLKEKDFNIIKIELNDLYDLGQEFYRWETATALSGAVLKINPFDQPNVQLAKTLAKEYMDEFTKKGKLSSSEPDMSGDGISVFGDVKAEDVYDAVPKFISGIKTQYYIAVMAFIPSTKEIDSALNKFRRELRDKFKVPVTVGYGPRFLHSTGQLHKGDANRAVFIQLTSEAKEDIEVPGKGYSFRVLISAQAQGDMKALQNLNRKVLRVHFKENAVEEIKKIANSLIKE